MLFLGVNEFGEDHIDGKYRFDFDIEVNGNMFDIEALADITIYAFEIYTFQMNIKRTRELKFGRKRDHMWVSRNLRSYGRLLWGLLLQSSTRKGLY